MDYFKCYSNFDRNELINMLVNDRIKSNNLSKSFDKWKKSCEDKDDKIESLNKKLKLIENYIDNRNNIPIEVLINIKNIINSDLKRDDE